MSPKPFALTVPEAVDRIRARNETIHAFLATRLDDALADAETRSRERVRSPLHGVPYSLKDEWEARGMPTTGGSWRFRERMSTHDGPVRRAFDAAGAVLLGKTNLSDMGLVPDGGSWVGGETRNPHDLTRTSGGSSGGAAAAVRDGMAAIDWGTDIGGSIRIPAAHTGIVGLRLSSETWPIEEIFPEVPAELGWMCAQGPLVRTTAECRLALSTLAPALRRGSDRAFVPKKAIVWSPQREGRWRTFGLDAAARLRVLGIPLERPDALPSARSMELAYAGVWAAHFEEVLAADPTVDFFSGLAGVLSAILFRGRFGDRRFYPSTARTLLLVALGRLVFLSKKNALARANAVRAAFHRAWDAGTVMVMPTTTVPAPLLGRTVSTPEILESVIAGNLADATALSIPFGTFDGGLPRGVQLLGPPGSEKAILELADQWNAAG